VDALDLFTTAWTVIESPVRAFRKIALATHKNYTLVLASLFGIMWAYTALWVSKGSTWIPNLFVLLVTGLFLGPILGIAGLLCLVAMSNAFGRRMGGKGNFRNLLALMAYAMIPFILSLIFIIPVDIGVFGLSFFGSPPTPWELKPTIYGTLLFLHGGCILWSLWLLVKASVVGHEVSPWKGICIALFVGMFLSAASFLPLIFQG
jgi:hypothetical protein